LDFMMVGKKKSNYQYAHFQYDQMKIQIQ